MSEQKGVQGRAWLGMHSTESLCVTVYVVKVDLLIMYNIVLTRDFSRRSCCRSMWIDGVVHTLLFVVVKEYRCGAVSTGPSNGQGCCRG